ncbi:MAG TPA: 50S ribosomal protein L29 [Blastocatellia bacterium]|nr:50S ribosomal protein L29 [Blastocatellia bacterium]
MKAEELRDMSVEELKVKENDLRESLFRLRFRLGLGETDPVKKYRQEKKDLARVLTVMRQRSSQQ